MAASTDRRRFIPVTLPPPPQEPKAAVTDHGRRAGEARRRFAKSASSGSVAAGRMAARASRISPAEPTPSFEQAFAAGPQERRQRRRAHVPPMYSLAIIRDLSRKGAPIEAHVLDISENGIAVEMDDLVPVGQPVTVEFRIAGLGRIRDQQWTELAAAAEVVRHDLVDDFPGGPYKVALRFVQIGTMAQAQIARFVATQPG